MTTNRSFRSTRSTRPVGSRRTRPTRLIALSTASAAGVAAIVAGGYAQAAEPRAIATSTISAVSTESVSRVTVEHQAGVVMEGTTSVGTPLMVTVYENSKYGNSIQVVLGDPDDENFGYVEQAGAFIEDGVLDVTIDVKGTPVTLRGSVVETGRPENIRESYQDAGQQIVDKGTHTQLGADVVAIVDGDSAPVSFAPAFAYDLESRKVTLYGR
jgi:hypothetical protein